MSLYGMMRTGVSGMNAQASKLGTVSDNIANANTTGYKRASTEFESMVMPNSGGKYNSGGVTTSVRYSISEQGSYNYTTSDTDLAVNGSGFFVVQDPTGATFLTRAGSFVPDANGNLVNAAGFTLLGIPPGTDPATVASPTDLVPVNFSYQGALSSPTTAGSLAVNLPADAADGTQQKTSVVVYDSQGGSHFLDFTYTKSSPVPPATTAVPNEWTLEVRNRDAAPTAPPLVAPVTLEFDANGALLVPPSPTTVSWPQTGLPDGSNLSATTIDLTGTSQLKSDFKVSNPNMNGSAPSAISGYQISDDGTVSALFEDGTTVSLSRVALANVASPDALTPLAGNVYSPNLESGAFDFSAPQEDGFGTLLTNALEGSNVDIGEELTEMIASQRSYTANSKVFQTGADLLDVLVNLKR